MGEKEATPFLLKRVVKLPGAKPRANMRCQNNAMLAAQAAAELMGCRSKTPANGRPGQTMFVRDHPPPIEFLRQTVDENRAARACRQIQAPRRPSSRQRRRHRRQP